MSNNTTHTSTAARVPHPALDEAGAAAVLGVHPRTLANWRSQGRGPRYVAVGRRRVYRLSDLEAYMSAHVVEPETH
jgi:hypothetical protein